MNTLGSSPQRAQTAAPQPSGSSSSSGSSDTTDFRNVLSQQIVQGKSSEDAQSGKDQSSQSQSVQSQTSKAPTDSAAALAKAGKDTAATSQDADDQAPGATAGRSKAKTESSLSGAALPATVLQVSQQLPPPNASEAAALAAASAVNASANNPAANPASRSLGSSASDDASSLSPLSTAAQAAAQAALALTQAQSESGDGQELQGAFSPGAGDSGSDKFLDAKNAGLRALAGTSGTSGTSTLTASAVLAFTNTTQKETGGDQTGNQAGQSDASQALTGAAALDQSGASVASFASQVSSGLATAGVGAPSQASVASATVPYQVGSDAWRADVSSHVLYFTQQDIQIAQLHLNPQHLGPLNIEIRVGNNQASVALNAAHEATRQALQDTLPQLHEMFAAHGVSLGSATVGDQAGGSPQSQAGQGSAGSRHGQNSGYPGNASSTVQGSAVGISHVHTRSLSMVDTFA